MLQPSRHHFFRDPLVFDCLLQETRPQSSSISMASSTPTSPVDVPPGTSGEQEEELRDVFKVFDKDGDQVITTLEIKKVSQLLTTSKHSQFKTQGSSYLINT